LAGQLAGRQKVVFHLRHLPLLALYATLLLPLLACCRVASAAETETQRHCHREPALSISSPANPTPLLAAISGRFWPLLLSLEQNISADMNFALELCVFFFIIFPFFSATPGR